MKLKKNRRSKGQLFSLKKIIARAQEFIYLFYLIPVLIFLSIERSLFFMYEWSPCKPAIMFPLVFNCVCETISFVKRIMKATCMTSSAKSQFSRQNYFHELTCEYFCVTSMRKHVALYFIKFLYQLQQPLSYQFIINTLPSIQMVFIIITLTRLNTAVIVSVYCRLLGIVNILSHFAASSKPGSLINRRNSKTGTRKKSLSTN